MNDEYKLANDKIIVNRSWYCKLIWH